MKNLATEYTEQQLREALNQRIELNKKNIGVKGEKRQKALEFIKGKKYLMQRHMNPIYLTFYSVDTSIEPIIENDKHVSVRLLSEIYVKYTGDAAKSYMKNNNGIRIDSEIVLTLYDNRVPYGMIDEKRKKFNPDIILEELTEISKEDYEELVDYHQKKEALILTQFSKFKKIKF